MLAPIEFNEQTVSCGGEVVRIGKVVRRQGHATEEFSKDLSLLSILQHLELFQ